MPHDNFFGVFRCSQINGQYLMRYSASGDRECDVAERVIVPGGRRDHFEFFSHSADGFTPARRIQSVPDSFRDREVAGTCYALDFSVFGILQNYLRLLAMQ